MNLILYFLVVICLIIIWRSLNFIYQSWQVRHIKGPLRIPIFGSSWIFIGKTPQELFKTLWKLCEKYENFIKVYVGDQLDIVLTDPHDVEDLLTNPTFLEKPTEYGPIKEWLGDGLLISSGNKWHSRRKILTSAFHFNILEEFIEVFNANSEILIEKLMCVNENEIVDVFPLITLYALDVICETSMGVKINAQLNQDSDYVKAVKEISEIISIRHYNFLLRSDFIFKLSPLYQRQKKVLAILHGFTKNVIKSRRKESLNIEQNYEVDEFGRKRKMALLDLLMKSSVDGKMLTDLDIREEVDTFMFEGHDTTTSAICFCLYALAKNPRVQENVYNEILNVFGDSFNDKIEIFELNSLSYLELVIKETLRLYPPVPLYGRRTNENTYLNGKFVPKNAGIGINFYFMGRMSSIWDNPNVFLPERFLNNRKVSNYFSYVPFSAGYRNCIGQKFAVLEMKSVVMKIIKNFEIEAIDGFEPALVAELILRSENGVQLKFKRRNN